MTSGHTLFATTHAVALAIVAATFGSLSALAQTSSMRPGRYAMTSQMTMSGQAVHMPAGKNEVCVTAEDMKDWSKKLAQTGGDDTCKLLQYKETAANLLFIRECTSRSEQTTTTYRGNLVFSPPNAYHEVVNISSVGGTAETNPFLGGSTINVMATRVGDCAK